MGDPIKLDGPADDCRRRLVADGAIPEADDPQAWGDDLDDEDSAVCHYCGGEGWGVVGVDWDSDDPVNGPYDGEIEECPCCGGSGDADDCVFW